MLYADDAAAESRSADGLARIMTAAMEVFRAFRLAVSGKKAETLLMHVREKHCLSHCSHCSCRSRSSSKPRGRDTPRRLSSGT